MNYGKELILDLHNCNPGEFSRASITAFMKGLCGILDMQAEDLHFWDDLDTPEAERETEAHLVGTSAVQFIKTSNITVHALDIMQRVYLNIFSCKEFDSGKAASFCVAWFGGYIVQSKEVERR